MKSSRPKILTNQLTKKTLTGEKFQMSAQMRKQLQGLCKSGGYIPGKNIKNWREAERLIEVGIYICH